MHAHILIIDDEPATSAMIELMLRSKKYTATSAQNGLEGLELLTRDPDRYQLILLDMMMPVMNGLGFLKALDSHPELKHIPIILQTGTHNNNDIEKAFELGVKCCLQKPFNRNDMVSAIQSVLDKRDPLVKIIPPSAIGA